LLFVVTQLALLLDQGHGVEAGDSQKGYALIVALFREGPCGPDHNILVRALRSSHVTRQISSWRMALR